MPVSSASAWSARVGSVMTSPPISRRTVPFAPRNAFSIEPRWTPFSSSSISKSMAMTGRASSGASHDRRPSISAALEVAFFVRMSSSARWIVVLPASFGPWMIVRPGASGTSNSR